jgi:acyl-CoA thioesterase-2
MSDELNDLIALMNLEQLDDTTFQGNSFDIGTGRVYGGQVLGQALKAAQKTVPGGKWIHSMHAYFMREGDYSIPITYKVDITRDGRSFSTRRVSAYQNDKPIFITDNSFQIAEPGLEYQSEMPKVAEPESLPNLSEYTPSDTEEAGDQLNKLGNLTAPFDIKPASVRNKDQELPILRCLWVKAKRTIDNDHDLHRAILAYISDYGLVTTSLIPHGLQLQRDSLQLASIDHSMWFHRPFRVDQWLLYATEPISTSNARGLSRGSLYNFQGELIASTIQEGLIRQIKKGE